MFVHSTRYSPELHSCVEHSWHCVSPAMVHSDNVKAFGVRWLQKVRSHGTQRSRRIAADRLQADWLKNVSGPQMDRLQGLHSGVWE